MKTMITILSLLSIASAAFANCSDEICNVNVGGKTVAIDFGLCSLGTQPYISFTGTDGKSDQLPSVAGVVSRPGNAILSGFWFDQTGSKVAFVDDGGSPIFNLQLTNGTDGSQSGTLTSTISGLAVSNALVHCPAN